MREKLKRPRWVYIVFIIGVASLAIRQLYDRNFIDNAFLYVAIPFIISFLLFHFARKGNRGFGGHVLDATIIMLASSAFLFEGFICVLFFYPIYILFVSISYASSSASEKRKENGEGSHLKSSFVPLIVAVMALEGTAPSTSFERKNTVTRSFIIDADVKTIQNNMAEPFELPKERPWFISVFPIPVATRAGSLEQGDIHEMDFVYKRWFFTNIKSGQIALRIDTVNDQRIETTLIKNTSYLSTYLNIKGSEIDFIPLKDGRTRVDLTMRYERLLDPAWYFGPLQKYASIQMCDYFVENVYAKNVQFERLKTAASDD